MKNLVNDFGADPTAQADSTTALQAAFNCGGDIELGEGAFLIGAPIVATKPIRLIGEKMRSVLLASTEMPDNYPVIHFNPDMQYGADGYELHDFQIAPQAAGVKACGIFFNTTGAGQNIRRPVVAGLVISQMADQSVVSANANGDGLVAAQFRDNVFMGGLFLQQAGDSIVVEKNIISGNGIGVYMTFAPGAANLVLDANNITSNGGAIYLAGALAPTIQANNIESVNYGYSGGVNALVFLQNAISTSFVGNNVNSGNTADCVRLIGCRRTFIDYCHFQVSGTAKKHIRKESDYGSAIGPCNTFIDLSVGSEVAGYFG